MPENDQISVAPGPRLYDIDAVGAALDAALASRKRPLDALIRGLRDKMLACLADGYTVGDLVSMLQATGVDGTERQLRYALAKAGIDGGAAAAARASRRGTSAGRSGGRKTSKPKTQIGQAEAEAEQGENEASSACASASDARQEQSSDKFGQAEDEAGTSGSDEPAAFGHAGGTTDEDLL